MAKLYGKDLQLMAARARLLAVDAVYTAASGHPGGSLSCMDIMTALYFNELNIDPSIPAGKTETVLFSPRATVRRPCIPCWLSGAFSPLKT